MIGLIFFFVENILLPVLLLFDGSIGIITFKDLFNTFEKSLQISIRVNEILQNLDSGVLSSQVCAAVYRPLLFVKYICNQCGI